MGENQSPKFRLKESSVLFRLDYRRTHLLVEIRHGDAQVLAHEIEERIAEDAHRHGAEFPVFETLDLLVGHAFIGRIELFCRHLFRLVRGLLQVRAVAAHRSLLQGAERIARPRQADEFRRVVGLDDVGFGDQLAQVGHTAVVGVFHLVGPLEFLPYRKKYQTGIPAFLRYKKSE